MKYRSSITEEEIKYLPRKEFNGEIYLIDTLKKLDIALPLLKDKSVLGFDTETRPSFSKGPNNDIALLQLATSDEAFLFRLNYIGFPQALKTLFEDDSVLKIGLALKDDLSGLKRFDDFKPASLVDLQDLAKELSIQHNGLKKLAAIFLNFRVSKSRSQRLSNWERPILTPKQLRYAATDAWVCYELYHVMSDL
ncbi:MAG: 3'-5' exonuclease [Bacteroidales bacterium]